MNEEKTITMTVQELANIHNALLSLHVTGEDIFTVAQTATSIRQKLMDKSGEEAQNNG